MVPLTIPPLRERGGDVPLLAAEFLKVYQGKSNAGGFSLGPDALRLIESYPWPGNVRELQNVIQYAVVKATGPVIGAQHLPPSLASASAAPQVYRRRPRLTRAAVEEALLEAGGNHVKAARLLGVARATLYRFLSAPGD